MKRILENEKVALARLFGGKERLGKVFFVWTLGLNFPSIYFLYKLITSEIIKNSESSISPLWEGLTFFFLFILSPLTASLSIYLLYKNRRNTAHPILYFFFQAVGVALFFLALIWVYFIA